jgi:hypothetical protein
MPAATQGSLLHRLPRQCTRTCAFKETKMLGPRDIEQDRHSPLISKVQEPLGRDMIGADRVDRRSLHPGQILPHATWLRERLAVCRWLEGAVRYAPNAQSLTAAREELSLHTNSIEIARPGPTFVGATARSGHMPRSVRCTMRGLSRSRRVNRNPGCAQYPLGSNTWPSALLPSSLKMMGLMV